MKLVSSLYSFLSDNRYLLPVGITLITLVLLLLTLMPSDFMGHGGIWGYDKIGHMVLFGSWCFSVGLYYQIMHPPAKLWAIFSSGALFGLLIEIMQYLLPIHRDPDPYDFFADVLGCVIAVWVLKQIKDRFDN